MKLSDLGEFGLINRIRKLSQRKSSSTVIGIGDDAAAVKISASHVMLVTTDLLLEDVHFDLRYTDYYSLGWKSAAVNLSDIAAMGGTPRYCLTALGIPRKISADEVYDFYRGFDKLLDAQKTILVGGDTCSSQNFFISVTAVGDVKLSHVIRRSGARPGDHIFVTGTLGDSAAGLELLQMRSAESGIRNGKSKIIRKPKSVRHGSGLHSALIKRHLRPAPRVEWGRKIALSGCASAMIDISDGLSSDLFHICKESRVGADILADRIPLSSALKKVSGELSNRAVQYALDGGEDYELLFSVPENRVKKIYSLNLPVTEIGTITKGRKISVIDRAGKKRELRPKGYDHFRRS